MGFGGKEVNASQCLVHNSSHSSGEVDVPEKASQCYQVQSYFSITGLLVSLYK